MEPDLLSEILRRFAAHHPELFRSWFSDIRVSRLDRGVLQLAVRNAAQHRYLFQKCAPAFIESAQAVSGNLIGVDFHVADDESLNEDWKVAPPFLSRPLRSDFTFEEFVVGSENRLAHGAAAAIANEAASQFNPLFLYGAGKLGKTHLLQAVCHAAVPHNANRCYVTGGEFSNAVIQAVERCEEHVLREEATTWDLLAFDGAQHLIERPRTQEMLFEVLNAMMNRGARVIATSDRAPGELTDISERLRSRFSCGLVLELAPPCLETRMAIIRRLRERHGLTVSDETAFRLAERSSDPAVNLEEELLRLETANHSKLQVIANPPIQRSTSA